LISLTTSLSSPSSLAKKTEHIKMSNTQTKFFTYYFQSYWSGVFVK
jgi:formate/nitrite transporter FocA (FNT family)